jgi:precorrin-6B methylase 2
MLRADDRALPSQRWQGPIRFARYAYSRLSEEWHERRLGIDTRREETLHRFGFTDPEFQAYSPISYPSLHAVMRMLTVRAGQDVFVDYGAGRGRVVVVAATMPFRRVVGVELIGAFAAQARQNVSRAMPRLRCRDVQVQAADARDFALPADGTIVHFFNPFRGAILTRVVERLRESLVAHPRRLTVLFANPDDFERVLRDEAVLPPGWVTRRRDVLWPDAERADPDANRYRIYDIEPGGPG